MKGKSGNVVIGYTTDSHLCLDCDLKPEDEVIAFSKEYAKFHNLGSSLVMETSDGKGQMDLLGRRLKNFCIIFGKIMSWEEVKWHIQEAYRLGMVHRNFLIMRKIDKITIRVNSKNGKKPAPKIIHYFSNGDRRGAMGFLRHWKMCKSLGRNKCT